MAIVAGQGAMGVPRPLATHGTYARGSFVPSACRRAITMDCADANA